jgi:LacI family transcriptional regulator
LISQAELPFATLAVDNHGGARRLALALAGLGYRRFAVLHGGNRIRTSADRRRGCADGLREAAIDPVLDVAADFSRDGGLDGGRRILAAADRVDAIVAVTDVMAIGAMSALRDAGLVPGRDIAVAGFDDIAAASDVTPALTTVRVPLRDAGRQALELALAGDTDTVVEIPAEVVLRASTPGVT